MRPRVILAIALAAIALGGVLLVPAAFGKLRNDAGRSSSPDVAEPSPSASPGPPPPPTLAAKPVSIRVKGFFSWALLDRNTDKITGSSNVAATNSTESMIKVWIVSDYLRTAAAKGRTPTKTRLRQASVAIRDSDDNAAQRLYVAGGGNAVVRRMIKVCGLTDTSVYSGWWSRTRMSARDAVRLGDCVADGRAAGPKWTSWVLKEMRSVRGTTAERDQKVGSGGGRWGIIDGLPREIVEQGVGIKNGWTPVAADNSWHINCLAVADDWVLAVLLRYPVKLGLTYGANTCQTVAEQLVHQPAATP